MVELKAALMVVKKVEMMVERMVASSVDLLVDQKVVVKEPQSVLSWVGCLVVSMVVL
jgi:hypothetical protein